MDRNVVSDSLALYQIKREKNLYKRIKDHTALYILLIPAIIFTFIFVYVPLPGIVAAFMDFDMLLQFKSPWVGLDNFKEIFTTPMFLEAIINTLKLSFLTLVIGFLAAVLFALLINELRNGFFKGFVQTVSYLPYFLAWIAVIGIVQSIYSINGPVNDLIFLITGNEESKVMFLAQQSFFVPNALLLHLWKNVGWGSIIYLAAMSGIDQQLYEASHIDGASRFRQIWHITLPGIKPTFVMLLILSMGSLVSDNFELVYGLQNPYINFEVIGTVVFQQGISQGNYSLATAFGLSQGIVQFILVLTANYTSKKINEIGIF